MATTKNIIICRRKILSKEIAMKVKQTTLQNGINVVYSHLSDSESVCVYLLVKAGTQHEHVSGLAHFVEHVLFKGTANRPTAFAINNEIEQLGGFINAATGQEYTEFCIKIPAEFAPRALDVLRDILTNSLFDETELEKEKNVIIEEINMYEDMPIRSVSDSFYTMLWNKKPLGRSVLGTPESISSITPKDVRLFVEKFYTPENMIISVAGNLDNFQALPEVKKFFGDMSFHRKVYPQVEEKSFDFFDEGKKIWRYENQKISIRYENRGVKQTHFCFGMEGLSFNDGSIYALMVAGAMLAEGSGSYLWQKIREEMGASYYLNSEIESFRKTGIWYIHAGVDDDRFPEVLATIVDALKRLRNKEFSMEELLRAKEYLKGDFLVNLEGSDAIASYMVHELFEHGMVRKFAEEKELIDTVTLGDITKLAKKLLSRKIYLNVLTNHTDVNKLREIINL